MKIVVLVARLLLGLIFVVFGLNGFLNFLSMGPMPAGLAGQFIGALALSHYFWVVAGLQIAGGALLLANRFVPLGLVLLGPVIWDICSTYLSFKECERWLKGLSSRGTRAAEFRARHMMVTYVRGHFDGLFSINVIACEAMGEKVIETGTPTIYLHFRLRGLCPAETWR